MCKKVVIGRALVRLKQLCYARALALLYSSVALEHPPALIAED